MQLIDSTQALAAACARLATQPFVAVDTEFMRETTFFPKLCLIQMASDEDMLLVDPLAPDLDLAPFFALMNDPSVTKVFHSCRQDLEIIWLKGRTIPTPLFDTQVAAMVCGYGDQVSYEQLVNDLAKARVDKSSRFTDWSRRPLSEAQTAYALSDVTHLRVVYKRLVEDLEASGRRHWLDEEMAVLTSPATYENSPEDAWRRHAGRVRKPRDLAVLKELAAWRDLEAREKDVPRARIMKDDALVELALAAPRSIEAMAQLRSVPRGFERSRSGALVLTAIERAFAIPADQLPVIPRERARPSAGATLDLLKVLLKAIAEKERVAPRIIASSDDLEAIALDDDADVPPLHGWRRELFGAQALALKHGELALCMSRGRVSLMSVAKPAEG
jgi:ribonuclease D